MFAWNKANQVLEVIRSKLEESYSGGKRSDRLDLMALHTKFDPAKHTEADVMYALRDAFEGIASDLGVNSMKDDGFLDWAGDRLHDAGVPRHMIDSLLAKLEKGHTR